MKIKQKPEDFYVEEIIELELEKEGDYVYFWLIKKNWTTMRAIQQIARALRVSRKRFRFAGTKDKFAITKQAISAYKIEPAKLKKIAFKDLKIEFIGFGSKPIILGDLKGNKFKVVLRDLSAKDIDKIKAKLRIIAKKGFPNLFGPQRFGRGNTHLIGRAILKGELESAVKLLLTFIGEKESAAARAARTFAAQNWGNWKVIVKALPKQMGLEKAVLNWLIKHPRDFAGALRQIPKPIRKLYIHAYQAWLFNQALLACLDKVSGESLIPGYDSKLRNDCFGRKIRALLKADGLQLEHFKCARMPELAAPGLYRVTFIKPISLKCGKAQSDELNKGKLKMMLEFALPKGVYATQLIRWLYE